MPKEAILYIYGYSFKTCTYVVLMVLGFVANTFVIYLHAYREGKKYLLKKKVKYEFH